MRQRGTKTFLSVTCAVAALLVVGCATAPPSPTVPPPPITVAPPPPSAAAPEAAKPPPPKQISHARTARDYRRDGATHLYQQLTHKIFPGKLPPLLHAVGVLHVDLNECGEVTAINWGRAPSHAPQVMQEIEAAVRQASPFPAPIALGSMTYTDTWLWDKSGRFQLDTLTEGQLGETPLVTALAPAALVPTAIAPGLRKVSPKKKK